jgi:hypothetical protein
MLVIGACQCQYDCMYWLVKGTFTLGLTDSLLNEQLGKWLLVDQQTVKDLRV